MPNIFSPNGFSSLTMTGTIGSFDYTYKLISVSNTQQIFRGDPVIALSTGYIRQYQPTDTGQIAGIFDGCIYFSISQGRQINSPYWPGSDALPGSVVQAKVITSANYLFQAQTGPGTQTVPFPITGFDQNYNIGYYAAPTPYVGTGGNGNIFTGFSTAFIDATTGSPSDTALPFRVLDYAPGVFGTTNGYDNTTPFNIVKVAMNFADTRVLTGTSTAV
jgi:hypothetical protein